MDPLSVIASVAGIATAAGEVIKILGPYTTATKDAHKIATDVSSEALATRTIITGLEQLISNLSAANVRYASLIQVDQLTAVLFDGVKMFSELLDILQTLPPLEPTSPGGSLWTPIQWVRKKGSLTAMLHRLRAFKSSIVCILSILQSDSQARAEESQQQLITAVDILLIGNNDLSRRMMGMDNIIDAMSHRRATIQSTRDIDAQERKSTSSQRSPLFEFDFEHDLKLSRVYRLAKRDTMDFSVHSSVARTHAWSNLSGMSLSDISHISVLALPLYVEDISNPQHYSFGQDTIQPTPLLAPTLFTRSIYHDCIEVQLQLSQLEWFAQFQQQESSKDENPLSSLITVFRLGTPLLMLFDQLDSSHHETWKDWMASTPSDEVSKLAIAEFVEACMNCLDIPPSYCVSDTDILVDDTTCHVKVINLVRLLLARLTKAGIIQAIVFESTPSIFAVEHVVDIEPNPAGLAVDAFLCDERLYVNRLESLFENSNNTFFRMLSSDASNILFASVGPLVNAQRKFLINAEMLVSKPYLWQTWQLAFQEWAIDSRAYYASLITEEPELKSMVRAAFLSNDVHHVERRGLLSDVLATLGLPSQRLDKYDAFLEELTQYGFHDPHHIESAKGSLKIVKGAVNNSNIARELNLAKAALSKDQDYDTNKVIWGLGKLLMFDKVDIMDARQDKIQLFLFQKGIVQATESFPKGRRRAMLGYGKPSPPERLRPRLSITQIIPAKDLKQVQQVPLPSEKEINICEIKWMSGEKECRTYFTLASQTRTLKWMKQATRVKRENQLHIPSDSFLSSYKRLEYNLVLLGAGGCGTSDLTIQLLKFVNPDLCDQFDPSKKDTYRKSCVIDNEYACIDLIDTTGQEEYSAMIQQYMRQGEGFILVYSVTSRRSFEEITTYYHQILKQKDKDQFPMVIVGIDRIQASLREVTIMEGEFLANELGCIFVEVDAKSSVEVDAAFFDLVNFSWNNRKKEAMELLQHLLHEVESQLGCDGAAGSQELHIIDLNQQVRDRNYRERLSKLLSQITIYTNFDPIEWDGIELRHESVLWQLPAFCNRGFLVDQRAIKNRNWALRVLQASAEQNINDIWNHQEIENWMSTSQSTVLFVIGNSQSLRRLERFSVEVIDRIERSDVDNDWYSLLAELLKFQQSITIVLEVGVLRNRFLEADTWAAGFLTLIQSLQGKTRVRIMILTGRPINADCNSIVKRMLFVPDSTKDSSQMATRHMARPTIGQRPSQRPVKECCGPSLTSSILEGQELPSASKTVTEIDSTAKMASPQLKHSKGPSGDSLSDTDDMPICSLTDTLHKRLGADQASESNSSKRATDQWFQMLETTTHEFMYKQDLQSTVAVKVAVLDTGFAYTDPEDKRALRPYYQRVKKFANFIDSGSDAEAKKDPTGHGTTVAVQILRVSLKAVLYICRVVSPNSGPDKLAVEKAIRKAAAKPDKDSPDGGGWGVDIINMSFGWPYHHEGVRKAIDFARQNGVHLFAATSNDGLLGPPNDILYPARSESVIAVDAADGYGEHAKSAPSSASQHSRGSRFSAPGLGIASPNSKDVLEGSSFACPIAAGVAALILEFTRQSPLNKSPSVQAYLQQMPAMLALLRNASSEKGPDGLKFLTPWKLIGKIGEDRMIAALFIIVELRKEYGLEVGREVLQCLKLTEK
ncbi:hypothetical protein F52700_6012 [Fusarium sp. NRRL 52700]|nr:hypothetical protein F52700_6012 [Fusarium sp. NRRL 52700]